MRIRGQQNGKVLGELKERGKYAAANASWWSAGLGFLVGGTVVALANSTSGKDTFVAFWTNWLDPGIAIATLVAAVSLSVWSAMTAWADNLEKRLDVHCTYGGRYVASCWEASLAHEGDIRQWAQQIAGQMLGSRELKFTVTPIFHAPENRRDATGIRRVYTIEIELTEDPTPDSRYLVWDPRNNSRLFAGERPTQPLNPSSTELKAAEAPS